MVFLHYVVKFKGRFVGIPMLENNKVDKFYNIKHLINILWLQHTIKFVNISYAVVDNFHMLELKKSFMRNDIRAVTVNEVMRLH